jgi:uncharacterized membrane protein HdeD (DUF308 family)
MNEMLLALVLGLVSIGHGLVLLMRPHTTGFLLFIGAVLLMGGTAVIMASGVLACQFDMELAQACGQSPAGGPDRAG